MCLTSLLSVLSGGRDHVEGCRAGCIRAVCPGANLEAKYNPKPPPPVKLRADQQAEYCSRMYTDRVERLANNHERLKSKYLRSGSSKRLTQEEVCNRSPIISCYPSAIKTLRGETASFISRNTHIDQKDTSLRRR